MIALSDDHRREYIWNAVESRRNYAEPSTHADSFIANEGGRIEILRLVKLSFLLKATSERSPKAGLYDFVPYKYGPYSFTLNYELRAIERDGWVRVTDRDVELLRPEREELSPLERGFAEEIDSLTRKFKNVGSIH